MSQTFQKQKTTHNSIAKAQTRLMKFLLLFLLIVSIIAAIVAIVKAHQIETTYNELTKNKNDDTEK